MLSVRALVRAAPRVAQWATPVVGRGSIFCLRIAPIATSVPRLAPAFSTSALRLKQSQDLAVSNGSLDSVLAEKLQSEIDLEKEALRSEDNSLEQSINDRLKEFPWKVDAREGSDEVKLTRQFGTDKVVVTFSLTDMSSWNPPNEGLEDDEEGDEEPRHGKGRGDDRDDNGEDEMDDDMEDSDRGSPIPLSIVIEKAGRTKTVLSVDAGVLDGAINIEDVRLFENAKLATDGSPEAAMARASLYAGPQFNTLDEDLQVLVERYLEDRGINSDLALLVSEYVQHKEQKEYVQWLKGIKAFVEA